MTKQNENVLKINKLLHESLESYRSLAENSTDYIMRYNRKFEHIYANKACLEVSGKTWDEYIGKTHREIGFDEEQSNGWQKKIQYVFDTGKIFSEIFEWDGNNGKITLDWKLVPEFSSNGKVKTVLGISRDVSDQKILGEKTHKLSKKILLHDISKHKNIEEELIETQVRLNSILNTVVDCIITINKNGNITTVNNSTLRLFGYNKNELIGKNVKILMPEPFHSEHDQYITNFIISGYSKIIGEGRELYAKKKNGEIFPIYLAVDELLLNKEQAFTGIIRDISKRKKAENELKSSNEYLEQLLLNLPAGVAIFEGKDLIYSKINKTLADINGLPIENHLGKPLREVLPKVAKFVIPRILKVIKTGKASEFFEFASQVPKYPGKERWFMDRFFPVVIDGQPNKVGVVVIDITERKKTELALIENEENLRLTVQNSPIGIITVFGDNKFRTVNASFCKMLGYTELELLKMSFIDITHPDDIKISQKKTLELRSNKVETFQIEKKYITKNGKTVYANLNAGYVKDTDGKILFLVAEIDDITERKNAEQLLKESQEKLKLTIERSAIGITNVSNEHKFIAVNPAFCKMLGYSEKELLGKTFIDITHPDDIKISLENNSKIWVKKLKSLHFRKRYLTKEGKTVNVIIHSAPVFDEEGDVIFDVAEIENITELKLNKDKLKKLKEENESFLSHELVNMISAPFGYSEILLKYENAYLDKNQIVMLERIKESLSKISRFTENFKKIQNLEFGNNILKLEPININELLNRCILSQKKIIDEYNVKINFVPVDLNCKISFDTTFINGVFNNLIKNAIEHVGTEKTLTKKEIKIEIIKDKNYILIEINNRGKIISKDKLLTFFDKFNVIGKKKKGGMGLGTSYAYLVTKAHGGEISVTSNKKYGTTVSVKFESTLR